jgi:TetR/AcrR family transcriptional regulator
MSALPDLMHPRTSEVPSKRERRKEARPGELLEAALDLFVEKGFAGTRAEEVAARAGVSKGTLFLYFPSKEELFKAVVRENFSARLAEWNREFEAFQGSSADMLRRSMELWWQRLGAGRASGMTKLVISEARNFPDIAAFYQREVIGPGQDLIRRMLQRGVDRGEFVVADIEYAIYSLIAPMIFLIMMKHSLGACEPRGYPLDPARYLASQIDVLLHGFSRPPARPIRSVARAPA